MNLYTSIKHVLDICQIRKHIYYAFQALQESTQEETESFHPLLYSECYPMFYKHLKCGLGITAPNAENIWIAVQAGLPGNVGKYQVTPNNLQKAMEAGYFQSIIEPATPQELLLFGRLCFMDLIETWYLSVPTVKSLLDLDLYLDKGYHPDMGVARGVLSSLSTGIPMIDAAKENHTTLADVICIVLRKFEKTEKIEMHG